MRPWNLPLDRFFIGGCLVGLFGGGVRGWKGRVGWIGFWGFHGVRGSSLGPRGGVRGWGCWLLVMNWVMMVVNWATEVSICSRRVEMREAMSIEILGKIFEVETK